MKDPVIVGGVGGSGTRVVASVLNTFKVNMGHDLNKALDNLAFTLLFRRPGWMEQNLYNKELMATGLRLLTKSYKRNKWISSRELKYLLVATYWMTTHGLTTNHKYKGIWSIKRLIHIMFSRGLDSDTSYWGWKEPNSHLLIEHFNTFFTNFKYIHTVRHGFDMAYSSNQLQLYNWGNLFGIEMPKSKEEVPLASFRYWTEANKRVLEWQNDLGEDKIYILNFDRLCRSPEEEIDKLLAFLNLDVSHELIEKATLIPQTPSSTGRYKKHDINIFNAEDLKFLEDMGFEV